ncbi:DUF3574 domain-containing protein [Phenylobacterium terrae]|uniref:DUF3574 domain-containing protein n=1 Tax=Phenylobacterium terrae TaxID=2665495 RepID=A0ABW4N7I8_9CAUL
MTRAGALLAALALAGCATSSHEPPPPAPCPAGEEPLRTAQLFFGPNIAGQPGISETAFTSFVEEELTPRFPQGLTVLDGGRQWQGSENALIRQAAKVVVIVLPRKGSDKLLDEVRARYKSRFQQESVLLIVQDSCLEVES